jgi:hypothetical protein
VHVTASSFYFKIDQKGPASKPIDAHAVTKNESKLTAEFQSYFGKQ